MSSEARKESLKYLFERVVTPLDDDHREVIVTRQSATTIEDAWLRDTRSGAVRQLTRAVDVAPEVTQGMRKRIQVTRPRDGYKLWVDLVFPRGWTKESGTPGVIWFYPREYATEQAYQRSRWTTNVNLYPAVPAARPATATAAKPARSGMGAGAGCAIAVAVGFVGLMVIGILAAIAIPAYHDYTQRALVMQHIAAATPIKLRISEAFARQGECPSDLALESKDVPAGFSEVWTGRFEDGTCGAQFTFDEVARLPGIKGKKMWFWLDETGTQWKCSSDLDNKILPASCRG